MKAVFIGANPTVAETAMLSVGLRWPDAKVLVAATAAEGLEIVAQECPNLVLVHPDFPDMALPRAIKELRALSNAPSLVLGRQAKNTEVIASLELGADDYVRLPCSLPVLMMRIYALLRLSGASGSSYESGTPLLSGEMFINPATCQVFLDTQQIALSAPEFRMLRLLVQNWGSVVDYSALEPALGRGRAAVNGPGPVKKCVCSLRKKLGDNAREPRWIATAQGAGYLFVGPAPISETPRSVTV